MSYDPTAIQLITDPHELRISGWVNHTGDYFSAPYISHVKDNLYQGGCKTGLILPENIKRVVSLYPWEEYEIGPDVKRINVEMFDSLDKPDYKQIHDLARLVNTFCDEAPTLVHCQAGLNRSGLVAAAALCLRGYQPKLAIQELRDARGPQVLSNSVFEDFILENF